MTFTIEPDGDDRVKLTLVHDEFQEGSALKETMAKGGWPPILANLVKMLEGDSQMSSRSSTSPTSARPPQKLWDALLKPEFTRQYFFGVTLDSDWKVGSPWKMTHPDGTVSDAGEVIESDPPKRLVLKWQNQFPNLKPEGFTRCTFDISDRRRPDQAAGRPRGRHGQFQDDCGGVRRLAEDPLGPEDPARDRHASADGQTRRVSGARQAGRLLTPQSETERTEN